VLEVKMGLGGFLDKARNVIDAVADPVGTATDAVTEKITETVDEKVTETVEETVTDKVDDALE
jgi:hypothetical protein